MNNRLESPTTGSTIAADVIVVGARCAGAATAMQLARLGHDVVVVDRATQGADTVSTHAISRSGMVQLQKWGLIDELVKEGAPPIDTVVFHGPEGPNERRVKNRCDIGFFLAPRRNRLDTTLQRAAARAGATMLFETTANGVITDDDGRAVGLDATTSLGERIELRAKFVIGADGLKSRIAKSLGARTLVARPAVGAAHFRYVTGDFAAMEYFRGGPGGFAGIFPTNDNQACIWVSNAADHAHNARRTHDSVDATFEALVEEVSPLLRSRIGEAGSDRARGMIGMPNFVREATGPGWALVGDAAYHRDPITGHGITDAFRDAELLAGAIDSSLAGHAAESTALANYEAERIRMLTPVFDLTTALLRETNRDRFVQLQRDLSTTIEAQADELYRRIPAASTARLLAA